jgi:hypothetical protein
MPFIPGQNLLPPAAELQEACETVSGFPAPDDQFTARLQFIADLLADARPLPTTPIFVWRDSDQSVRHAAVAPGLVVGRNTGEQGLSFPGDKLLSRRHFVIHAESTGFAVEDLNSHNGTAVNRTRNRIQRQTLHDGDLLFAGERILVFLDQGRIS